MKKLTLFYLTALCLISQTWSSDTPDYLETKHALGQTGVNHTDTDIEPLARTIALFRKLLVCDAL